MSVQKSRNRYFILKIVLLTILLIGALSGVFVASIFQFIEGFHALRLAGVVAGVLTGYWAIRR